MLLVGSLSDTTKAQTQAWSDLALGNDTDLHRKNQPDSASYKQEDLVKVRA